MNLISTLLPVSFLVFPLIVNDIRLAVWTDWFVAVFQRYYFNHNHVMKCPGYGPKISHHEHKWGRV